MDNTRRSFLATATAIAAGATAGCLGSDGDDGDGGVPEPPVAGDPDADVTVTVYDDFACPHCRTFKLEIYPQLVETYIDPGRIRFEQRDFPIPVDGTWSWAVASAAREAFESEGDEAFWSFSTAMFERQTSYSYDTIEAVAEEQGLDAAAVREAAEDVTHRSTLEADKSYGRENGVQGTPAIFVDGEQAELQALTFEQVSAPIDAALE